MHLRTLGGLRLEGAEYGRLKPLLLVAYLALEGPKSRRHLSELFWPGAPRPMNNLRVAVSQLRRGAPGVLQADGTHLRTSVTADAHRLLERLEAGDHEDATGMYRGAFVDGLDLSWAGAELEEWVYGTREFLAARVRDALLLLAERNASLGDFRSAGAAAEAARGVAGAPPLEPEALVRLHRLLLAADSLHAEELEREARELGIDLDTSRSRALAVLAPDRELAPASPNNLPVASDEFVGRDPERLELAELLEEPAQRLVTLLGPGGVGKSRLALEAARAAARSGSFRDGVYLVALEALTSDALVPGAIAAACGLPLPRGPEPLEELTAALQGERMLLVLDNCEHLPRVGALAARLLAGCAHLKLLATSRDRLQVPGEQLVPVEGLATGAPDAERGGGDDDPPPLQDAVRLFVQRGRRARLGFEPTAEDLRHVRDICRRVDGFPLGIELAASWLRLLSPEAIARELRDDLDFLSGPLHGAPERHASLRATFEHSWRLLSDEEREALRRVSVFVGGFSRPAAARVAGASIPVLASLADKSLLRTDGNARFHRHPLVHRYSHEKLAERPEELRSARDAHAAWCLELVREAEATADGAEHGERLEREHDNLRAALDWTLGERGDSADPSLGVELAVALYRFWYYRSHLGEGRRWLGRAVARARELRSTAGHPEAARNDAARLESSALHALGVLAGEQGDAEEAAEHLEARVELARALGDPLGEAASLNSLGVIALADRDYGRARERIEASIALRREAGRTDLLFGPLLNLGLIALAQRDLDTAQEHFEAGLAQSRELGNEMGSAIALSNLAAVSIERGEAAPAGDRLVEAARLYDSLGNRDGLAHCLEGFAGVAVLQRRFQDAARLSGAAASLRDGLGLVLGERDRAQVAQRLAPARAALGAAAFERAWRDGYEAGYERTLDEAVPR